MAKTSDLHEGPLQFLLAPVEKDDDTDDVTARILAAAREQIETVGWRRSTIEDIARRARLGRATVYRKFPSKKELLDAVIRAGVREYYAARAALPEQPTPEDRIAESARFTAEFLWNLPMLKRLLETEPEAILPALTLNASPLFDIVVELAIPTWRRELHGDAPITEERLRHFRTVAELHARITLSFLLTRESTIPLETPDQVRQFARDYLAPMLIRQWPNQ